MTDEYVRKQDAVSAVEFGITYASAINIETGEWTELFKNENDELREAIKRIHDMPSADVVPVSAYKQVMWERDTAVEQLKQIDKGLGEIMDDVVSVVRCKNCENWQTDWNPSIPDRHYCAVMDSMMKANDFCSYGEMREDTSNG